MGRHSDRSTVQAWADVFGEMGGRAGVKATSWIVILAVSLIPAAVVGGIWFILFADITQNPSGATTTSVVVAFATFVASATGGWTLAQPEQSKRAGRHRKK